MKILKIRVKPQTEHWRDKEGLLRKYEVYEGKPKSTVNNFDKYGSRDYSERRREEIKRLMAAKMLITSFKPEIRAQIRLNKQLK